MITESSLYSYKYPSAHLSASTVKQYKSASDAFLAMLDSRGEHNILVKSTIIFMIYHGANWKMVKEFLKYNDNIFLRYMLDEWSDARLQKAVLGIRHDCHTEKYHINLLYNSDYKL
jgi:hypothetical protein